MSPKIKATIAMQSPGYRNPASLPGIDICPECKTETAIFIETQDGVPRNVHRCVLHGDVVPMKSAIKNESVDWSAASITTP